MTGPIAFANDGNNTTAWGIDVGPGRSNEPAQRGVYTRQTARGTAGVRLTFKLVQNHGGWNSDDNQNNNLGRFRFAMTSAESVPRRSDSGGRASDRAVAGFSAYGRASAKLFSYWRTTVPEWNEENRRIEAFVAESSAGSNAAGT